MRYIYMGPIQAVTADTAGEINGRAFKKGEAVTLSAGSRLSFGKSDNFERLARKGYLSADKSEPVAQAAPEKAEKDAKKATGGGKE